jgi:Putative addiction module component
MSIAATPPEPRNDMQADSGNVPAWHKDVLEERLRHQDNGDEATSSWTEAKERIRARIKAG